MRNTLMLPGRRLGSRTTLVVVLIFVLVLSAVGAGHGLDGTAIAMVLAATAALLRTVTRPNEP